METLDESCIFQRVERSCYGACSHLEHMRHGKGRHCLPGAVKNEQEAALRSGEACRASPLCYPQKDRPGRPLESVPCFDVEADSGPIRTLLRFITLG